MAVQVVWKGTSIEGQALITALGNNCACEFGVMGVRKTTCSAHDAFAHEQRFLDGLLNGLHLRADLMREEWLLPRERE